MNKMINLTDPVNKLHLVRPASETALRRLGIQNIEDLLYHFPRDWQDLRDIQPIKDLRPGTAITIRAKIKNLTGKRSRWKRMHLTEALLEDQTGNVVAIWYNQPYLTKTLQKGAEYYFHGVGRIYERALHLGNPSFEPVKENTIHTAAIVPHYDLTEGITQKQIRYWLKQALSLAKTIPEHLPDTIILKYSFPPLSKALSEIHFPSSVEAMNLARQRLAFDELFLFQLAFQLYRQKLKSYPAPPFQFDKTLIQKFVKSLPFELTHSQRVSAWEILQDLERPYPMNRLLEGDVGSGKTVVAGIAMLQSSNRDWQAVLLAPTEILALQHYETLQKLFKNNDSALCLYTRNHKTHKATDLAGKYVKIIIGTHALLQNQVKFRRIGLLVVDEQHRFGVNQRSKLQTTKHGVVPHLLSMSATPIPRTLALAFYGDLDISQLKELPKGRKKITTRLISQSNRLSAYEFIREEIIKGRQIYVVAPLIGQDEPPLLPPSNKEQDSRAEEKSEQIEAGKKSVVAETKKLKNIFPDFTIASLHGRMKGEEKKQIMEDFKAGRIHILVTTTVIEVGVDVPNATIMLIENAERFGLAQIHQLRGRVGRSSLQSYCLLFAESNSETAQKRLQAVIKSNDGFELAEQDLRLRGPGEILGAKQSGFIPFKLAELKNHKLIKQAREEAEDFLRSQPDLNDYPYLKTRISLLAKTAHLE